MWLRANSIGNGLHKLGFKTRLGQGFIVRKGGKPSLDVCLYTFAYLDSKLIFFAADTSAMLADCCVGIQYDSVHQKCFFS